MWTKSLLLAAIAALSSVNASPEYQGFNSASTKPDTSPKLEADFRTEFAAAKNLPGTDGNFTSVRLYTMIQAGTQSDPIQAIPAAIAEDTSLLLGIWCSAGQTLVTNEILALTNAIKQYGDDFTKRVVGLSVGSEDLYRNSPMGIEAGSLPGTNPSDLVSYVGQVKKALSGTGLANVPIGHVDTWTAWVNGSNSELVDAVDFLGFDAYPYFQSTMANSIDDASTLFWQAYDNTQSAAKGKEVWITETGWPVSGNTSNLAKADVPSAQQYWNDVGCEVFGNIKTYWYILTEEQSPSFGIVGSDLSKPFYDLSCKGQARSRQSASTSSAVSSTATGTKSAATAGSTFSVITSSSGSNPTQTGAGASQTSDKPSFAVASKDLTGAMGLVAIQMVTFLSALAATTFFTL